MVPLLASDDVAGTYVDWGVVHVSLANLLIIVLMVGVFIAALLIPFPAPPSEAPGPAGPHSPDETVVDH